mgnify:CR=1 FL=1
MSKNEIAFATSSALSLHNRGSVGLSYLMLKVDIENSPADCDKSSVEKKISRTVVKMYLKEEAKVCILQMYLLLPL